MMSWHWMEEEEPNEVRYTGEAEQKHNIINIK